MAQTTLTIDIDSNDKRTFEEICRGVDMTASSVIKKFIHDILTHKELPFTHKSDPYFCGENLRIIKRSIADAESGKLFAHNLIEVGDE